MRAIFRRRQLRAEAGIKLKRFEIAPWIDAAVMSVIEDELDAVAHVLHRNDADRWLDGCPDRPAAAPGATACLAQPCMIQ
ncbi:hypothetical protein RALTA_B2025 [Cupriavidus taiwanensis LMG 19424]|uniref:Uncharacterized protein n=1 Tax=Cupriavidus taiwanensis (strain DSM 17343 / BCRC 17206 / CCUG 44338 / CIP 107171 / LMG 19424 / R1) TaxID=977880 RepID=B3RCH9_CUPTR|nr:hypothetical protein RALTA_B2025 [Cupriavidus taiwanensis LMG 19424]